MELIAADHTKEYKNEILLEVKKLISQSKKKSIKIAIEGTKNDKGLEVFEAIQKEILNNPPKHSLFSNKKIEFVPIDSKIAQDVAESDFKVLRKAQTDVLYEGGTNITREELNLRLTRSNYTYQYLRDHSMAKRIKKAKPDIILIGSGHAPFIGKYFKITPKYIGMTKSELRKAIMADRKKLRKFIAERKQRKTKKKANQLKRTKTRKK